MRPATDSGSPVTKGRDRETGFRSCALIDNRDVIGEGALISIVNPATEQPVISFNGVSIAQVDEAVGAARAAFESECWKDPAFRSRTLHRLADLIEKKADELMSILMAEIGVPIALKDNQLGVPLTFLRWFADAAVRPREVELGVNATRTGTSRIVYRSSGVVAAIIAYNYPLHIAVAKFGAALAAGCTVVMLPSPQAPLAVLKLGELVREAGFPKGVFNIVAGGMDAGKALSEHPGVDKVSFTGSVNVGRQVMRQAASGLKGITLELGGKSAAIFLPGSDFGKYVNSLHARYARHAGQGCGAPTRILVEESRIEEFIGFSRQAYLQIKVGAPPDPRTIVGPVISETHRARIEATLARAVAEGAKIVAGGGRPSMECGWFINPALVLVPDSRMEIAQEEIFGPVAVLLAYRDLDQAIKMANDTDFGLKAYLYGEPDACAALAPVLRVGTVIINGGGGVRPDAPSSGWKQSGIGREWGEEGIREFLDIQHIDLAMS